MINLFVAKFHENLAVAIDNRQRLAQIVRNRVIESFQLPVNFLEGFSPACQVSVQPNDFLLGKRAIGDIESNSRDVCGLAVVPLDGELARYEMMIPAVSLTKNLCLLNTDPVGQNPVVACAKMTGCFRWQEIIVRLAP